MGKKSYTPEYKAKLVLEMLREERHISEIAAREGIIGRKLIRRYMGEMGIYAVYPKPNSSKRGKDFKAFSYLLKNKTIFLPNQVWAVDITYIKMGKKHMYLTAIIDWYSRFIVGWELSDTLDTAPVLQAVRYAIDDSIDLSNGRAVVNIIKANLLSFLDFVQTKL